MQPPLDLLVVVDLPQIDAASRALVYCYVDYSMAERVSRSIVQTAVARLRSAESPTLFQYFAIDESAKASIIWLKTHRPEVTAGWGTVLWLEYGQTVAFEYHAMQFGLDAIVNRTRALWGGAAKGEEINPDSIRSK